MGNLTIELIYKAIHDAKPKPSFRNNQDRIAFTVHAAFIASGFRLLATGPAVYESDSPSLEEVSIQNWNDHGEAYGFIYFHPELNSKKVFVEIIVMFRTMVVYGSRVDDDSKSTLLLIEMDEYSPKKEEEYLGNLEKLLGYIEKGLVDKFDSRPSKYHHYSIRHVVDGSRLVDIWKLEDIVPSSDSRDVPRVNRLVDYELIDISNDGLVCLLTDNGGIKYDIRLPNDDNLLKQVHANLAEEKYLVVSVMMSAMGEEQICAVKVIVGGSK